MRALRRSSREHAERLLAQVSIRIVLAERHTLVRSGLRVLLDREAEFDVVAECAGAETVERCVSRHEPDVLVLDLDVPGGAAGLICAIRRSAPATRILGLAASQDVALATCALQAGAQGYVLKQSSVEELVQAIRRLAEGESYLAPAIGARIAAERSSKGSRRLSVRELQVLGMIAAGHTNPEIAEILGRSVRTIESHRMHIQKKLLLRTRAELVAYARAREALSAAVPRRPVAAILPPTTGDAAFAREQPGA